MWSARVAELSRAGAPEGSGEVVFMLEILDVPPELWQAIEPLTGDDRLPVVVVTIATTPVVIDAGLS